LGIDSFVSSKLKKFVGGKNLSYRKKFIKFTEKAFIRTYPHGLNINSGNYDPVFCWNLGC